MIMVNLSGAEGFREPVVPAAGIDNNRSGWASIPSDAPGRSRSLGSPMQSDRSTVTLPTLQQMKREGRKSVGVVVWDYQTAQIADRAGVDFVVVGDSVGVNLWG